MRKTLYHRDLYYQKKSKLLTPERDITGKLDDMYILETFCF